MSRLAVLLLLLRLAAEPQQLLGDDVEDAPTLGSKDSPRLIRRDTIIGGLQHPVSQNHTVLFYHEDSGQIYVGGTDSVIQLDPERYRLTERFHLPSTQPCQEVTEGSCDNIITVIQEFQDSVFVCGTNAGRPQCWKLFPSVNNRPPDVVWSYEGAGISAFTHTQASLALAVEGDLYAAAPLDANGNSWQFRRKVGSRPSVWMDDSWLSEPTFIATSWVKQEDDPDNEKIYMFFREKNSDHSPEADPWISRVARVCKVDEGGSKRFFQNMWTSFLKARLVCGFPGESLYFNRLLDVYVTQPGEWRASRVYALFTSSWNATAVCIYSIEDIEQVFENSTFKGYEEVIPSPRPGACVKNSRSLPEATVTVVKNHPEMSDWVHSLHHKAPFYTSNNNYTKIVVDRVQAADARVYNVLLLATDSGKIHKVLEVDSKPFIISQTLSLSNQSTVQAMKLDSKNKKLIVAFSEKIAVVDLQSCQGYNSSCEECVLARDPYCAWTKSGSSPTVPDGVQSIVNRHLNVCTASLGENRTKRDAVSHTSGEKTEHSVPLEVPFYLTCPIHSYHAAYTWRRLRSGSSSPCLQMRSNCLLLIPSMAPENYGSYECVSTEGEHVQVVKTYHLTQQLLRTPARDADQGLDLDQRNAVSAAAPRVLWVALGLLAVVDLR